MQERELRLALICYGGISLAVYMHGITKEAWHLARASRAIHDGGAPTGVEAAYARLLAEVEERGGARLRVLPDIVAGASAGGINGIFLGQAIATGQSLDPLTDLWLAGADVEVLIDPDAAPASRLSKVWALPLAWMAAGRSGGEVDALDPATREEVRAKLSHFIRSRWFEPPFGGAVFTRLLVDAFEAMAAGPAGPRLLPDGQPFDLFVTVTDFTGHPERLRLNSPPEVVETEHRLVIDFSDRDGAGGGLAALPELVFAARATSSFPGAFPPFTVAELDAVLAERGLAWPGRRAFLSRILPRHAAAGTAERAVLIDGSVLANAPFRPAIEALAARPARRRVDRRFVYIDPSPGMKFRVGGGGPPGFFQTILGAISELPRQQPIRDNLEAIAARSDRIDRLRAIVDAVRPAIDAAVEAVFGRTLFLDRPTPARLVAWRERAHRAAEADAGIAYAAYDRMKREGVIDTLTDLAHQLSRRAGDAPRQRLRAAIAGAFGDDPVEPLRRFDVGFRIRRLRLLARRVAELEGDHPDGAIAPARRAVYAALARYLDACRTERHADLRGLAHATRDDAGPLVAALAGALDLHRLDAETDEALAAALAENPRAVRRPLLLAYLGFLYFDVATMPLLQGEGLDEFDPIRVDRIAPDDAASIRGGGAEATLKGIQFNSFGAFFSRAYRENDYLWGRLHGAERLIDITVSTLPADRRMRPGRVAALKREAFLAILDEEEARLTAVPDLVAELRREVG